MSEIIWWVMLKAAFYFMQNKGQQIYSITVSMYVFLHAYLVCIK